VDIFDRLSDLVRSMLNDEDSDSASYSSGGAAWGDPDLSDAYEELDEFLKTGKNTERPKTDYSYEYSRTRQSGPTKEQLREGLRADYKNLETPYGASFEEVKKAHKRMLRTYHPDRHAGDAAKLKEATLISQKINQSFQRIKQFEETGKVS